MSHVLLILQFPYVFAIGWFEKIVQIWNPKFYIVLDEDNLFIIKKVIK